MSSAAAAHEASAVSEVSAHTPTVGSLLRAELLRIRLRRFTRGSIIGLLAVMALIAIFSVRDARNDPSAVISSDLPSSVLAVGLGVGALVFILGCTLGGAEWSQRTMPALLFWEPRRIRLFAIKVVALAVSVALILLLAVVVWLAVFSTIISVYGDWSDGLDVVALFAAFGRALVLCVVTALFGFGLANLTRNTGAALGVAFVYLVLIDPFIGHFVRWVTAWLPTPNLAALLTYGGVGISREGASEVHIGALQGGIVLTAYALVLCTVAALLFRRRDVT